MRWIDIQKNCSKDSFCINVRGVLCMFYDLISKRETIETLRIAGNPYNNFIERNIESIPISYDITKVLNQLKENGCIVTDKWKDAERIIKYGGTI